MGSMSAPLLTPDTGVAAYEKVAAASCGEIKRMHEPAPYGAEPLDFLEDRIAEKLSCIDFTEITEQFLSDGRAARALDIANATNSPILIGAVIVAVKRAYAQRLVIPDLFNRYAGDACIQHLMPSAGDAAMAVLPVEMRS
jgi:hypothetical protein